MQVVCMDKVIRIWKVAVNVNTDLKGNKIEETIFKK